MAEAMASLALAIAAAKEKVRAAEAIRAYVNNDSFFSEAVKLPLKEARERFERAYLQHHYEGHGGNISAMAKFIGVERSAVHRKMERMGMDRPKRILKRNPKPRGPRWCWSDV